MRSLSGTSSKLSGGRLIEVLKFGNRGSPGVWFGAPKIEPKVEGEGKPLSLPPFPPLLAFPFLIEGEAAGQPAGGLGLKIARFRSSPSVFKTSSSGGGGARVGNDAERRKLVSFTKQVIERMSNESLVHRAPYGLVIERKRTLTVCISARLLESTREGAGE